MLDRSDMLWQQRNFKNTPEGATQRHAMSMDVGDRERSERLFNQMFGFMGGGVGPGGQVSSQYSGGIGEEYLDAESRLAKLLDDPNAVQQTGAYKFRYDQGQEALERSLGARGMLGSGNRLTELQKYGQDMASQEYDNQFGRLADLLGKKGQERTAMFSSLANVIGQGALGRGGTDSIWGAYGSNRNSQIAAQSALDRQRNQRWSFSDKGGFSWGAA